MIKVEFKNKFNHTGIDTDYLKEKIIEKFDTIDWADVGTSPRFLIEVKIKDQPTITVKLTVYKERPSHIWITFAE